MPKSAILKYIFLFLFALGACTQPAPAPTTHNSEDKLHQTEPPGQSHVTRNGDTAVLRTAINNRKIEVFAIADSLLRLSQEGEATITIPFYTELFAYCDTMDINRDHQNDLFIYGHPNMHGQMSPYVFLSNNEGKLRYREDLSICNLCYDTATKQVISFYIGGVFSDHTKNAYIWKNDSLQLVHGASITVIQEGAAMFDRLQFYKGNNRKVYRTVIENSGAIWDTAVFKEYPSIYVRD